MTHKTPRTHIIRRQHASTRLLAASSLAVIIAVSLVATSCGLAAKPCGHDKYGLPTCSVTAKSLMSHPEATLAYPDSTRYSLGGNGEQHYIGQTNAAETSSNYATTAPMAQVYAWYHAWLVSHGWHPAEVNAVAGAEVSVQGYARDNRESFTVGEDNLGILKIYSEVPARLQSETLYETAYLICPYKQPC